MEPSAHCRVKVSGLARLFCFLSVLISLSRGSVLVRPVPTPPPEDGQASTDDLSTITPESDETHINQVLGNNGSKILLGDIISDEETVKFITQDPRGRNAITYPHGLWSRNTVPYIIDKSIERQGIQAIKDAIKDYHKLTCVKFVGRTTQKQYIRFTRGTGCSSSVGRTGRGEQKLNLHQYCWYKGIVIHELSHALGFFHEQSRTDRDSYIKVLYENIQRGKESNFDKFSAARIQHLGEPYDYGSIMHYGPKSFSRNGLSTIVKLKSGGGQIGQRKALSANDIRQINKLYKCSTKPVKPGPDANAVVYCSFDLGTPCKFYQDTQDDFDWTVHRGSTSSGGTGPRTDMSGRGWYIYAESSRPRKQGNRAVLLSPPLTGPYCLRMHFHMLGSNMGSLNVYKVVGSRKTTVFSTSGNKGDQWYLAQTSLTSPRQFQIAFEAVRGNGFKGDIALDEIKLTPGKCDAPTATTPSIPDSTTRPVRPTTIRTKPPSRHEVYCNFDTQSLCKFTQGTGDEFDWIPNKGVTSSAPSTGPSTDVSSTGYYIYAEASFPRRTGDRTQLVSPSLIGDYCVQFYYHMFGNRMGTLRIRKLAGAQMTTVETYSGDRGNTWYKNKTDIRAAQNQQYQVVFEAERGQGWAGDIALDEIRLTPGHCRQFVVTTTPPPPKQVFCNFDSKSWCGFTQDTGDDFDWRLHRGQTGSHPTTGPTSDFSGHGYYVYAEGSRPRIPGDRARLISPAVIGTHCVEFRYNMHGAHIDRLEVFAKVGSTEYFIWRRKGDQGDTWSGKQFRIDTTAQFQIIFVAIRGKGYQSDIALDEIRLIPGGCVAAQPNAPIPTTSIPLATTKVASSTTTKVIPARRVEESSCLLGWSKHGSSCYKAFNVKSLWFVAKVRCKQHGGYLVAVNDANEHNFVKNMTANLFGDYAIWIGLRRDFAGDHEFTRWDNGEPLTYTNWTMAEPNNLFGDEDCVAMYRYGGGWLDTTCTGRLARRHPFICEITLESVIPKDPTPTILSRPASCGVKPVGRPVVKPGERSSLGMPSIGEIVGGKISSPGAWPWQAAILCKTCRVQAQDCGGTLVSAYHVVTAAHCVRTSEETFIQTYKVRLGEHHFEKTEGYEQDIDIASVTIHQSFGVVTDYDRDIAVIKLASPARINGHVRPVCLQSSNADFPPGTPCYITGWGRTSQDGNISSVLREAKVPIVSAKECKKNYGRDGLITSNMLCAGFRGAGIDACQGDSGGPLVCEKDNRWYLVGTTSWGWGCAGQYYGVYTNIAKHYYWIKANMV